MRSVKARRGQTPRLNAAAQRRANAAVGRMTSDCTYPRAEERAGISFWVDDVSHAEHDGGGGMWLSASRLGDETAAILEPPLSTGAGGCSPDTSPGMVDRPSKRQCGARMRRSRSPRTARVGELTKQAPWQVRTRPSRALLRPVPGKRSRGHRAQPERPAPPPNPSSGTVRCEAIAVGVKGVRPLASAQRCSYKRRGEGSDPFPYNQQYLLTVDDAPATRQSFSPSHQGTRMCGIVGLFLKDARLAAGARTAHGGDAGASCAIAGRTARGLRSTAARPPASPRSAPSRATVRVDWAQIAARLGQGDRRERHGRGDRGPRDLQDHGRRRRGAQMADRQRARGDRAEPGPVDRDLQGRRRSRTGSPTGSSWRRARARTPSATRAWRPSPPSPSPARIRSRPARTPASCTTARCRTTTACASSSCATASASRPTTTARWRPPI